MTAMIQTLEMQEVAADRYIAAFRGFVALVKQAIATSGDFQQASVWERKVLAVFEQQLSALQPARAHLAIGDDQPLIGLAMKSTSIARDMDGYSLMFAGEELAKQLEEQRRVVVFAAWQFCESAGAV
jgi:hypothetical protein